MSAGSALLVASRSRAASGAPGAGRVQGSSQLNMLFSDVYSVAGYWQASQSGSRMEQTIGSSSITGYGVIVAVFSTAVAPSERR